MAKAISIRQPWAWLILHAGKDIENRDWPTKYRGPVYIHASKTMTHDDYEAAMIFLLGLDPKVLPTGLLVPRFEELQRGGVVGSAVIVDCVTADTSPWFCGDYGFKLADAKSCEFMPKRGSLGLFTI